MLDVNYINDQALTDILQAKDVSDNDEGYKKISEMSVRDAFDAYLLWNGIVGHTDQLIEVYESLKKAEIKGIVGDFNQSVYEFQND